MVWSLNPVGHKKNFRLHNSIYDSTDLYGAVNAIKKGLMEIKTKA